MKQIKHSLSPRQNDSRASAEISVCKRKVRQFNTSRVILWCGSLFLVILLGLILVIFVKFNEQYGTKATIEIDGREFQSFIARTEEERAIGLGKRDSLCRSCAMLFIFPDPGTYGFWMKDMRFNLDIIWIAKGKIVYIAKNFSSYSPDTIKPEIYTDRVLEINSGLSDQYGFKIGDNVEIKL